MAVKIPKTEMLLTEVLREVRGLRRDIELVIPSESLKGYAHPQRILSSYRKAIKKYPPRQRS